MKKSSETLFKAAVRLLLKACPDHMRFTVILLDQEEGSIQMFQSCCPVCGLEALTRGLEMVAEDLKQCEIDATTALGTTDGQTLQ